MLCPNISAGDRFQSHFYLSIPSSFSNMDSTLPHHFTKEFLLRLSIISTSFKPRSNYQFSTYFTFLKHSLLLALIIPHSLRYSQLLCLFLSMSFRGSSSRVPKEPCIFQFMFQHPFDTSLWPHCFWITVSSSLPCVHSKISIIFWMLVIVKLIWTDLGLQLNLACNWLCWIFPRNWIWYPNSGLIAHGKLVIVY